MLTVNPAEQKLQRDEMAEKRQQRKERQHLRKMGYGR
jgi:hypothetical protein